MEVLGHYLDAMGPFLKYSSDAVGSVINKLFELLTSLPFAIKVPSTTPFQLYFQLLGNSLEGLKLYILMVGYFNI